MDKLAYFKGLHEQTDLLFLPNAWDVLSAIILEQAGFKAIGTTSYGVARVMGYEDGQNIEFDDLINLVTKILSAVDVPITVDIESGYSDDIAVVSDNVLLLADLGVVGINIEDSLKGDQPQLNEKSKQCDLFMKIRSRLNSSGYNDFFINARIDTYLQKEDPFNETIERATAYISHGANGVFVPGLANIDEIKKVVELIDAPLNLMSLPSLTDSHSLENAGVKRFSLGFSFSDATLLFVEEMARSLYEKKDTKALYTGGSISTSFNR